MKILGIDPGFERVGIAVLEGKITGKKEVVLHSECFKTSAKIPFEERLILIGKKIEAIINEWKPEVVSVETLFLNTNQKTAMRVAEARGVILYEAIKSGAKLFEASPPQIKMATTGYGRAGKNEIIKMVKLLLNIDKNKNSDDELDAMAIALTALAHYR